MADNGSPEYIKPPAYARSRGISPGKVIALIRSGQLKAVNLAVNPSGRARYRIPLTAVKEFEEARSSKPPTPKPRRRRRRKLATSTKEWF